MNPLVQELILAMSAELAILRAFIPDDVPYVDKKHLEAAAAAKERTQRAALAVGCKTPRT